MRRTSAESPRAVARTPTESSTRSGGGSSTSTVIRAPRSTAFAAHSRNIEGAELPPARALGPFDTGRSALRPERARAVRWPTVRRDAARDRYTGTQREPIVTYALNTPSGIG